MSDTMDSQRITGRHPKNPGTRLRDRFVEACSALDLAQAAELIACAVHTPEDLSTNRRHFEGFGESKFGTSHTRQNFKIVPEQE